MELPFILSYTWVHCYSTVYGVVVWEINSLFLIVYDFPNKPREQFYYSMDSTKTLWTFKLGCFCIQMVTAVFETSKDCIR